MQRALSKTTGKQRRKGGGKFPKQRFSKARAKARKKRGPLDDLFGGPRSK